MEYLDYLVLIVFLSHLQIQDNHKVDEMLMHVDYFSIYRITKIIYHSLDFLSTYSIIIIIAIIIIVSIRKRRI